MLRPQTIQIFLPAGDPQGIRIAEITTRIVRVVAVPRALLSDFFSMPEASGGAVYLLVGGDEDTVKPTVYIGQTGDLKKRLTRHNRDQGWEWQHAVVVLSRAESLTSTHSLYLERLCIQSAKEAGRYVVENDTNGNRLNTTRPLEAECEELLETAKVLITTLGYRVFAPAAEAPVLDSLFFCTAAGADARAQYNAEGMVVLKGSKARLACAENFKSKPLYKTRQSLIEAGIMAPDGDFLLFTQDHPFQSPSSAAGIVVGNSMNGWLAWKDSRGRTLDEVKRQSPAT